MYGNQYTPLFPYTNDYGKPSEELRRQDVPPGRDCRDGVVPPIDSISFEREAFAAMAGNGYICVIKQ